MTAPWIEIEENQQPDVPAGPGYSDYTWQALFASQVTVLSYQDWYKLKWGFNASVLFDEALERQKLFIESQYFIRTDHGFEPTEYRTLAFRFVNRPGDPLLVVVIGKIKGRTRQEALEGALAFYSEIKHIFPYDYTLIPALSRVEFLHLSGSDVLEDRGASSSVAQVKRMEAPISQGRDSPFLQGLWKSSPRAHEQIWRLLAGSACPVILNITLRPTILYEKERIRLLQSAEEIARIDNPLVNQSTLAAMKQRYREFVERRMSPWGKFFYLQIHLASTQALGESLSRIVGTSLALSSNGTFLPGYQVNTPEPDEKHHWQHQIRNLDLIFTGSHLSSPRLSEVADLEEVFAAVRLPYSPPEDGLPGVTFGTARNA
ncbi:MAG TPA: hypothetical protein VFY26_11020 [Anaerolineales bacterium]|nr:hypothetical protein [Anaerolineales bacterium]